MVSIKYLLLSALASVSVIAQDTGDDSVAAAYWNGADLGAASEGDPVDKRDLVKMPRNGSPPMGDPYGHSKCCAPYTESPCETTCNRNNCFRGLLNARDGSSGKVYIHLSWCFH